MFSSFAFSNEDLFVEHGSIMLIIDPSDGTIVFANNAAIDFYGYGQEIIGMKISEINTLTDEQVDAEMALADHEMRNYFLFKHLLSSGSVRDVEVYSYPIDYKGKQMLFSIVFDVTDKLQAIEDLEVHNEKEKERLEIIITVTVFIIIVISLLLFILKKKNNKLDHFATYDSLTDVYNRFSLHNLYKSITNKDEYPIGFFMIDVNNLKFVNDTFGHISGDKLIIAVANMLNNLDIKKYVSRVSGDEFVLLIPSCKSQCMDEIRNKISNYLFTIEGLHFNVSVGAIEITKEMPFEEAFSISESIMYKDKSSHKAQNNESILNEIRVQLHRLEAEQKNKSILQKSLLQFLLKYLDLKHEDKQILEEAITFQDIGLIVANTNQIEEHVEKGYYILKTLHPIKQISTLCYHHHERFDGHGYPKGLKGDDIPYKVRILTLINCIYQETLKSRDVEDVLNTLNRASGHIFDPNIYNLIDQSDLKAFIQSQIRKIYEAN